jgi:hypothetical protein
MYILEERLISRIRQIAEEAADRSSGQVVYEEYIALPYDGQIILRFSVSQDRITMQDLDHYENLLYEIVKDEFLIDFMGSVYKKAGVDYTNLEARLKELSGQLAGEQITPSVHSAGLREDAEYLLKIAGLPSGQRVWEIQPDGDEWALLISGNQNRKIKEVQSFVRLYVGEVNEEACTGLIWAAFYAKRNHVSIARILSDH